MEEGFSCGEPPIQILEWSEAVRMRPVMYTGSTGIQGFVHILQSILTESYPFAESRRILNAQEICFEWLDKFSGKLILKKFKHKIPANICHTLYGAGDEFAILNALSRNFEFTLFDREQNEILKNIYFEGNLQIGIDDEMEYSADRLEMTFQLDATIWEEFEINPHCLSSLLKDIAFINKGKSLEIKYLVDNQQCRIIYKFDSGLHDLIKIKSLNGIGPTLFETSIEREFDGFSADFAFVFWDYSVNEPFLRSYLNNFNTHGHGTHVDALLSGIIKASKKFARKHEPDENYVITQRTVKSFLIASIHPKLGKPTFYYSTKSQLTSKEIVKPVSDFVSGLFFEKLENDKEQAKAFFRHFAAIHWKKNWLDLYA